MILLPISFPPGARPGMTMGAFARLAAAIAAAFCAALAAPLPNAAARAPPPLVRRVLPRPRPRLPAFLGFDLMISSRAVWAM